MILTIDIGNSRTKWGVFNHKAELLHQGVMPNSAPVNALPIEWQSCARAVISNVAGEAQVFAIKAMLQHLNISATWMQACAQACGVVNSYDQAAQLGSDRWASLVGAWRRFGEACVVVNAGTAMTVDVLLPIDNTPQASFVGGLIVPGLSLMQTSLLSNTADLAERSKFSHTNIVKHWPTNTADAIQQGAMRATVGAVQSVFQEASAISQQTLRCVVTGGNAHVLAEGLRTFGGMVNNVTVLEHLVLQGLFELEREL